MLHAPRDEAALLLLGSGDTRVASLPPEQLLGYEHLCELTQGRLAPPTADLLRRLDRELSPPSARSGDPLAALALAIAPLAGLPGGRGQGRVVLVSDLRSPVAPEMEANADAIAVDQDALGQMGVRLESSSAAALQRWVRTLANGDVAVALLNRAGASTADITLQFADVHLQSPVAVYDIWQRRSLGFFSDNFTAGAVGLLDTVFLRLTGS
jgi:hypothetical protein